MRSPSGLDTNDVFVPGQLPIRPNNVYASRGETEIDLRQSLERKQIPLVFGEYGVGKTSLARFIVRGVESEGKLVNIESAANKDLADVFKACLEQVGYRVEKKQTLSTSKTTTTEAAGKSNFGDAEITAKLVNSKSASKIIESEYAVSSPTDSGFIKICEEFGVVLIIDELHNASAEFRGDLAVFLKAYSNSNCLRFKIILLGTSSDASDLVDLDRGIDRKIQEFPIPSMNDKESRYVITAGMKSLGIEIPESLVIRLISLSVGSPDILQFLCLESAEAAIRDGRENITEANINYSVERLVKNRSRRLYDKYTKVIEQVGQAKFRKQILRAMAESTNDYVSMEEISEKVSNYLGRDIPSTSLSGPLRDLKSKDYEEILKDVRRTSGQRVHNLSAFKDPSMKAFIRLMAIKDGD